MKIISKFVLKNLQLNKKRTIVTIIGIMLSTALLCAVSGMVTSTQKTLQNTVKANTGDYHSVYFNVPQAEAKAIENNEQVLSYYLTNLVGIAKLDNSKNEYKPYVSVFAYDENALKNNAIKLISGRLPENDNEILISEHIKTNGGVEYNIGDTIALELGERVDVQNEILNNNVDLTDDEKLINTTAKQYVVTGIIERCNYSTESYNSPCYTLITKMTNNMDSYNVFVKYKTPSKYKEVETSIIGEQEKYNYNTNSELLRYEGVMSDNSMSVLYGIAAVVIVIIVVSSVFVIRNSFAISVFEKNKQFGMLTSIGATPRQLRRSVLLEGTYIGLIAIPLGILSGMLAVVVLIAVLNELLKTMLNDVWFVYSIPYLPMIVAVVLSAVTIYLSCIIPAIKASKISPIEAIRGNNDIKIKSKKLKTSKIIDKIFGIGGVVASKNLKRSKKKYRTTIISLVVSIAIFISLSTFMTYGRKMSDIYYTEIGYNISIIASDNKLYDDIETQVVKQNEVKSYARYKETNAIFDGAKYFNKEFKAEDYLLKDDGTISLNVIVASKEYFNKYITELGINTKNTLKAVLIDERLKRNEDNTKSIYNVYTLKAGDKINIQLNEKKFEVEIAKRTDKRPMGFEMQEWTTGTIIISEEYVNDLDSFSEIMYIQSTNANETEEKITKIIDSNTDYEDTYVMNIETYADNMNRMYLVIAIFLYGFITVITLIGVTNIFNTITTNMLLRSKEFAMLKSIGMTTKEFNRMIRLESLMYGFKSIIIGVPIGLLGSYALYQSFAQNIDIGFIWPTTSIIISIIAVFVIVFITMKYSLNNINKQNIIETIRQDNV